MSREFVPKITIVHSPLFLRDYPTVDCEAPERISVVHSCIRELGAFQEPEECAIPDLGKNVYSFLQGIQEACS